jgi:hypothetical protein
MARSLKARPNFFNHWLLSIVMERLYRTDKQQPVPRGLTASEIRKLPKRERNKILQEQFKLGGRLYAEDPDSIIPASQRVHD